MFDLKEPSRFRQVGKSPMKFGGPEPRKVRLEVLSEEPAKLYMKDKTGSHYIGTFEGYDVVQFNVAGPWELTGSGPGCKAFTTELDTVAIEIPEAVSFTGIMTRRQRNPELELMMRKVTQTMERRIAQVERDVSLRVARERRQELREQQDAERARAVEAERAAVAESAGDDSPEDEPAQA